MRGTTEWMIGPADPEGPGGGAKNESPGNEDRETVNEGERLETEKKRRPKAFCSCGLWPDRDTGRQTTLPAPTQCNII